LRAGLLVAACLAAPLGSARAAEPPASQPAGIRYGEPRKLADLANRAVRESSGLAASRRHEGVLWTHNDSGDRPRLFAFDLKGRHLATVEIAGARAADWEDMASYVDPDGKPWLVIGDVGDNGRSRGAVTLYVVPEPDVGTPREPLEAKAQAAETIRFTYDDGRHDCEAIAVDPASGAVYLVSKEIMGCKVYELARPAKGSDAPARARSVATVAVPIVTAMDISPDGLRAILATYGSAYEFTRRPGQGWAEAFACRPRTLKLPPRRQGEAICFGRDGATLYLTSEGASSPLWELPPRQDETPASQGTPGR